ncbi:hypothetical protein GF357_04420 [Candidatus Dojkabacteria bacterium]|nr:hypothetical protein [Candidatus Dojkabacteria bacterium]
MNTIPRKIIQFSAIITLLLLSKTVVAAFDDWNFVIFSDTQTPDTTVFDTLFQDMTQYDPKLAIHVGDLGWGDNGNSVIWGDFRYPPLKNFLDLQYKNYPNQTNFATPVEIHLAPGNHDIRDLNTDYRMREEYITDLCLDGHYYWGETNENPSDHHEESTASLDPNLAGGFIAFNGDINSDPAYCESEATNRKYSIERGNIQFLLLDWTFSESIDDGISAPHIDWIKNKVCNQPDPDVITLVFVHRNATSENKDADDITGFSDLTFLSNQLDCDHNVKAMFSGHSHVFNYLVNDGIHLVKGSGMAVGIHSDDYSDYFVGEVEDDKLTISRIKLADNSTDPFSAEKLFSIPGNFDNYESPQADIFKTDVQISVPGFKNYTSFPIKDTAINASDIVNELEDENVEVKYLATFQDGSWKSYKQQGEDEYIGEDFQIIHGQGYLIYSQATDSNTITLNSTPIHTPAKIKLQNGWNLVALQTPTGSAFFDNWESTTADSLTAYSVLDLLQEEGIAADAIFRFQNSRFSGVIYEGTEKFGANFNIENNDAYFIRVEDLSESITFQP